FSALDRAVLDDWTNTSQAEPSGSANDLDLLADEAISDNEEYEDIEAEPIAASFAPTSRYRSWIERTHNASSAWNDQYEELVDAYLHYNATLSDSDPVAPNESVDEASDTFMVEIVDLFARKSSHSVTCRHDEHCNTALVRAGYISPSPTNPTTAISIRTL
ncbi:hypothetical protein FS749_010129, partial [Ceratobasidium sp. UAMH 11750]